MKIQPPEYYFSFGTQDTFRKIMLASNDPSIFTVKIEQGTQFEGANKFPVF
jgi:hypothetical protein